MPRNFLTNLGRGRRTDVIVLNPPRKGCDEKVLRNVAALKPEKVIYVSCSPQTLSRDLDILAGLGFCTHEIQPVDMFPQTPHVENVALLTRKA
jgi:23S rRNA (uracil1939-C5)-methyltransferase